MSADHFRWESTESTLTPMSFVLRARELVTSARELTEFGRADGGEFGRVREEHPPSFSEVAVESDGALGRLGGEVRCGVAQLDVMRALFWVHCEILVNTSRLLGGVQP
jgi:hypothetical protein